MHFLCAHEHLSEILANVDEWLVTAQAKHVGPITRIASGCAPAEVAKIEAEWRRIDATGAFRVHAAPSTALENGRYKYSNKPGGLLHFLTNAAIDADYVALVDPDMVMVRPLTTAVALGERRARGRGANGPYEWVDDQGVARARSVYGDHPPRVARGAPAGGGAASDSFGDALGATLGESLGRRLSLPRGDAAAATRGERRGRTDEPSTLASDRSSTYASRVPTRRRRLRDARREAGPSGRERNVRAGTPRRRTARRAGQHFGVGGAWQLAGPGARPSWAKFSKARVCGADAPCTRTTKKEADQHFAVGPVYVAHVDDWKRIAASWWRAMPRVHAQYRRRADILPSWPGLWPSIARRARMLQKS